MKLGYVIIYVDDVKESMQFYEQAFGFTERMAYEQDGKVDYGEMNSGETVLAFASHAAGQFNLKGQYQKVSMAGDPPGIELVFVTENLQDAYAQALNAGCLSIADPVEKPWGQWVAYVRAREGTLIELCTPMQSQGDWPQGGDGGDWSGQGNW